VSNNPVDSASAVSFTSYGSVSLASGSSIDSGASIVFIKDGQIVLSVNDATLSTSTNPALPGTVSLSAGSTIVTSSSGADHGADCLFRFGNLKGEGARSSTTNREYVKGGNFSINDPTFNLPTGAPILPQTAVVPGTGGNTTAGVEMLPLKRGPPTTSLIFTFG